MYILLMLAILMSTMVVVGLLVIKHNVFTVCMQCFCIVLIIFYSFKGQKKLTVSWHTPNRVNIK